MDNGLKRSMPFENLIAMANRDSRIASENFSGALLDGKFSSNCKRQRLSISEESDGVMSQKSRSNRATAALEASLQENENRQDVEDDLLSSFPSFCAYEFPLMENPHQLSCTKSSQAHHEAHQRREMNHLIRRMATAVTTA